jgi:hypothetical protein
MRIAVENRTAASSISPRSNTQFPNACEPDATHSWLSAAWLYAMTSRKSAAGAVDIPRLELDVPAKELRLRPPFRIAKLFIELLRDRRLIVGYRSGAEGRA